MHVDPFRFCGVELYRSDCANILPICLRGLAVEGLGYFFKLAAVVFRQQAL